MLIYLMLVTVHFYRPASSEESSIRLSPDPWSVERRQRASYFRSVGQVEPDLAGIYNVNIYYLPTPHSSFGEAKLSNLTSINFYLFYFFLQDTVSSIQELRFSTTFLIFCFSLTSIYFNFSVLMFVKHVQIGYRFIWCGRLSIARGFDGIPLGLWSVKVEEGVQCQTHASPVMASLATNIPTALSQIISYF